MIKFISYTRNPYEFITNKKEEEPPKVGEFVPAQKRKSVFNPYINLKFNRRLVFKNRK